MNTCSQPVKRVWKRPFLLAFSLIGLVIVGAAAVVQAQTGTPAAVTAAQTRTGFTFQGQLQDNGTLLNATCDIQAGLWDAAGSGVQMGSTQTVNDVAVVDGRFTITLNAGEEFGTDAFNGQERWLQIAVRCPTGSGSYTTLQPRQPLTAAPYAHGLVPGVRMETDYVGLWGMQIAMSSDQAHGAIYTQMGDVINTGQQAGIRSDSTFEDIPAILGQSNQPYTAAIEGRNSNRDDLGTAIRGYGTWANTGIYGYSVFGRGVHAGAINGRALVAEDYAGSPGLAAYFIGDVTFNGICTGCTQAVFGANSGPFTLQKGDLVTIDSMTTAVYDNAPLLWQVRKAQAGELVIGVVRGAAQTREQAGTEQMFLMPGEEAATPGDLLSIIIFGPAPVRLDTTAGPLQAGMRVTAGTNGLARTLQTVEVDGITLSETAPTLGIALEAGDMDGDGLVWVLVNPN